MPTCARGLDTPANPGSPNGDAGLNGIVLTGSAGRATPVAKLPADDQVLESAAKLDNGVLHVFNRDTAPVAGDFDKLVNIIAGSVNGVSFDASADAAAYSNITALLWAHIRPYSASVAAIAGTFTPR